MVRPDGTGASAGSLALSRKPSHGDGVPAATPETSRALPAVQPAVRAERAAGPGRRPAAAFLAQLIAAAQRAPQARRRCRAEPAEAARAYQAALAANFSWK